MNVTIKHNNLSVTEISFQCHMAMYAQETEVQQHTVTAQL